MSFLGWYQLSGCNYWRDWDGRGAWSVVSGFEQTVLEPAELDLWASLVHALHADWNQHGVDGFCHSLIHETGRESQAQNDIRGSDHTQCRLADPVFWGGPALARAG